MWQDEAAVRRQAACCKKLVLDGRGEVIALLWISSTPDLKKDPSG